MTAPDTILLATHGLPEAAGAVRTAARLASATGMHVQVIAVLEPPPIVAGPYGFAVPVQPVWEERSDVLFARVQNQIQELVGPEVRWPIEVISGDPSSVISREAEMRDAAIIVLGLGQHHLVDRALGGETALRVLGAAHTPVLAVPEGQVHLPRRALVAVDFSDTSLAAAQQAIALLPGLTHMELLHVAPRWDLEPSTFAVWRSAYEQGVAPAFARVIRKLRAPRELTINTAVRDGKVTRQLLDAVNESGADVIVLGSRGLGFIDRLLVGSTATSIIRSAQCAIFALPVIARAETGTAPASAAGETAGAHA
jgi:nucleotide-binding universal stress UspA family protein